MNKEAERVDRQNAAILKQLYKFEEKFNKTKGKRQREHLTKEERTPSEVENAIYFNEKSEVEQDEEESLETESF